MTSGVKLIWHTKNNDLGGKMKCNTDLARKNNDLARFWNSDSVPSEQPRFGHYKLNWLNLTLLNLISSLGPLSPSDNRPDRQMLHFSTDAWSFHFFQFSAHGKSIEWTICSQGTSHVLPKCLGPVSAVTKMALLSVCFLSIYFCLLKSLLSTLHCTAWFAHWFLAWKNWLVLFFHVQQLPPACRCGGLFGPISLMHSD